MPANNGTASVTRPNTSHDQPRRQLSELSPFPPKDTKSHHTEAWEEELAQSRARVQYQSELATLRKQELSKSDFEAISTTEQKKREQIRQQDLQHFKVGLKDRDAEFTATRRLGKRERKARVMQAKSSAAMGEWRQRASHAAERLTSHDMRLAQLARQLTWTRRVLIILMAVGMLWSALNVQHNLVPSGDTAQPLFWASYGVEALVSGCLIILLMTSATLETWGYRRARHRRGGYALETVLVIVSLGLNIGTPLSQSNVGLALEYAVAPLMVGVLVWTYNYATGSLARVLAEQANADIRRRYSELLADGELLALAGHGFNAMKQQKIRPSSAENGGGVPSASALASELCVSKPRACQVRNAMKLLYVIDAQR